MDHEIKTSSQVESPPNFHVVGIGASAGGLAALELLVDSLPTDVGAAFVVVQHLSPRFESQMASLLGARTTMQVTQAINNERLEPNRIYVIPSGKEMIVSGRRLLLTDRNADERLILPIDQFLRSLATDVGPFAIAVILTGLGKDGSRGVVSVNDAGGLVVAQTCESAAHPSMPYNAIETGAVHVILAPDAIGDAIKRYISDAMSPIKLAQQDLSLDTTTELEQVLRLLHSRFQLDFTQYKPATINRRIERRMQLSRCNTLDDYTEQLREDDTELSRLYRDLLIGVTRFFRDEDAFEILRKEVVAPLIRHHEGQRTIRIWTPGCASGEEAYTLAMLFKEEMLVQGNSVVVKIFATDAHPNSIKRAGKGSYLSDSLVNVPQELRDRYFVRRSNPECYIVSPDLRHMIVFAVHDLLKDPPFTRMDIVVCRNLLIYFQLPAQRKCMSLFHFALATRGVLFLGPSESLGDVEDEFDSIDRSWRIFRKRRDIRLAAANRRPKPTVIPAFDHDSNEVMQATLAPVNRVYEKNQTTEIELSIEAEMHFQNRLIQRFMPAGFLIDDDFKLIRTFGGAEQYLRVPEGRRSDQLTDLLPEELAGLLAGALRRALAERKHIAFNNILIKGMSCRVRMTAEPLSFSTERMRLMVTVAPETPQLNPDKHDSSGIGSGINLPTSYHVATLENELQSTRENLNATVEELETSNEELQAANEELVASNEEMQSTNEELQSVNEELHSLNVEHQRKIDELTEITSDIENLFHAIDIGVLFLDANLQIRRITPIVTSIFNILPRDIGRDIQRFSHSLKKIDLVEVLNRVLDSRKPFETEVRDSNSTPWLLRVLPYAIHRDADRQLEGLVVTLVDMAALDHQKQELLRYADIVENCEESIIVKDLDGVITHWNRGATRMYGYTADEAIGKHVDMIASAEKTEELKSLLQAVRDGQSLSLDTVRIARSGRPLNVRLTMSPVFDSEDNVVAISAIGHDYTQRAIAESDLKIFKRAVDACRVGVVISDAAADDLPISYVNQGFIEMTGFEAEEVVGRNCRLLQGTDTDRREVDKIRSAIRDGSDCRVSFLNYRKDGSPFWNELSISPIYNVDRKLTHFVGIQQDITQQVNFESELAGAKLLADNANEARSLILSKISRNLERLLTSDVGFFGQFENAANGDSLQATQRLTLTKRRQILQLIAAVCQQSAAERSDDFSQPTKSCLISELFHEIKSESQTAAGEKEEKFILDMPESENVALPFDRLILKQILLVLIDAAPELKTIQVRIHEDESLATSQPGLKNGSQLQLKIDFMSSDQTKPESQHFLDLDFGADKHLALAICRDVAAFLGGTLDAKVDEQNEMKLSLNLPFAASGNRSEISVESARNMKSSLNR